MMLPPLTSAAYVETTKQLHQLVKSLSEQPLIAVDTESNSMYAYRGQVCLIQISTRTEDYIVDPLVIEDMAALGDVLYDPDIEKVFHAAEYDLILLKRDFGFEVNNLFDTMMAARLFGRNSVGLSTLLSEYFAIQNDKRHQLDNWGIRPLAKESLIYAQLDTHFLPHLRDIQYHKLVEDARLDEATEVFADVARVGDVAHKAFDPDGYWGIGRPHHLTRRQMAVLREVYLLRDEIARQLDKPAFKMMANKTLVMMARKMPDSRSQLRRIDGIDSDIYHDYGDRLVNAIQRGRSNRLPQPPPRKQIDPELSNRYVVLHAWRKERAQERGLESNIVLAKDTLWQIAETLPQSLDELKHIEGIGPWRLAAYGKELLEVIHSLSNGKK